MNTSTIKILILIYKIYLKVFNLCEKMVIILMDNLVCKKYQQMIKLQDFRSEIAVPH